MLTLALETSTRLGSIALGRGDELISECALAVRATHSETVLDEVARLLARARVDAGRVERLVIGAGPGSFTGVRIAAALAKGWCHARDVPLHAYSSLRSVAASAGRERVCALFDARRGEVYGAAYRSGGLEGPVLGPAACAIEAWLDRLDDPAAWSFAGEGAIRQRVRIEARGGSVLPAFLGVPRAAALLWLAERIPQGRVDDIELWEPRYVRSPGAERQAHRQAQRQGGRHGGRR
ncbi:tRNA (adenosine(37)-N6)-threonylcarbamoyltransferase complex dimerization subunit type 1 TsaB [Candidatus Palauibacter sp.]|uniref:tRNA (adenosine(37)-N6)-threonylcarbamoyltransferase complex dimerization subunit type 1 TsaB n=1 Tax=Candidatus Palauibacter sp. TaxID=3101350 RepID=UPI003B01B3FA